MVIRFCLNLKGLSAAIRFDAFMVSKRTVRAYDLSVIICLEPHDFTTQTWWLIHGDGLNIHTVRAYNVFAIFRLEPHNVTMQIWWLFHGDNLNFFIAHANSLL